MADLAPMRSGETSFYDRVYQVVRRVPAGRVTTYGAIANFLGARRSARLVGWAMNSSHGLDVPAHRVVNRVGLLTGKHHFEGSQLMRQLLESEGVPVAGDQVREFGRYFWDPSQHLDPAEFAL